MEMHNKEKAASAVFFSPSAILLMLFIAFLTTTPLACAKTIVSIYPSVKTVSRGETFTVNVYVEPDCEIAGMQFNLKFNSSLLKVNSVSEGDLFKGDSDIINTFFNPGTIDNEEGIVKYVYGCIITPGENVSSPGTFATINITASDKAGTSQLSFIDIPPISVIVTDPEGNPVPIELKNGSVKVNCPPVITSFSPANGSVFNESDVITIEVIASDPNDDALSYEIKIDGVTKSTASNYSWVTDYESAGTHVISVKVSDGFASDTKEHTIIINDVNRPPVLTPIGNKSVDEGALLEFTVSAYDPDNDTLTFTASNLPEGAEFNSTTRTFSWTPDYFQAGSYQICFTVSDAKGLSVSENITITVNNAYPPYDVNKDGIIDIRDLTIVGQHYGEEDSIYDLNGDGIVDVSDLVIVGQHFGEIST